MTDRWVGGWEGGREGGREGGTYHDANDCPVRGAELHATIGFGPTAEATV